jgi:uncharacterized protein
MRMTNDRDQAILRSAVSDAAANLLDFLPSLGTGEVFAFGEGVALPTRVKLKQLPAHLLPKSDAVSIGREDVVAGINEEFIATVLRRWRGASASERVAPDDGARDARDADPDAAAPLQPAPADEPGRPSLLRRPLGDRLDLSKAFQAPATAGRAHET